MRKSKKLLTLGLVVPVLGFSHHNYHHHHKCHHHHHSDNEYSDSCTFNLNCLNITLFKTHHHHYKELIEAIEKGEAIPFQTISIDYNNDGQKETLVIGAVQNALVCGENCETFSHYFYKKYKELGGISIAPMDKAVDLWNKFICDNDFTKQFYQMFKDMFCDFVDFVPIQLPFISDTCNYTCSSNKYTLFVIDLTNKKMILADELNFLPISGFITFKVGNKVYIGYTYLKIKKNEEGLLSSERTIFSGVLPNIADLANTILEDVPFYLGKNITITQNLVLRVYPLTDIISKNSNELYKEILIKTVSTNFNITINNDSDRENTEKNIENYFEANLIIPSPLYSKGIDWDLNGSDDIIIIPYSKKDGNDWKSHLMYVNLQKLESLLNSNSNEIDISQNQDYEKDFSTNAILVSNISSGFLYGKPYLFFTVGTKLDVNFNSTTTFFKTEKAEYFYMFSLCGKDLCSFDKLNTNLSDYAGTLSIKIPDLQHEKDLNNAIPTLDEGTCKEFAENHRSLRIELSDDNCINSAQLYTTYSDNNTIVFKAIGDSGTCGFIIKGDKIEFFKNGWCAYNLKGFYCNLNNIESSFYKVFVGKNGYVKLFIEKGSNENEYKIIITYKVKDNVQLKINGNSYSLSPSSQENIISTTVNVNSENLEVSISNLEPTNFTDNNSSGKILLWLEY